MKNDLNGDKNDNTVLFSVLSYTAVLWIAGLISDKDNPVVRFHVNQGIIKTIIFTSLWFVIFVVSKIFSAISTILIAIVSLLWIVYFVTLFSYMIIGIVNAKKCIQKPLPIIGTLFNIL